jgi:hypothetical protein
MLNDPRTVTRITAAARPLTAASAGPAEPGLTSLRQVLEEEVGRFPALPAGDPGRADAAFCLFLHVHASGALREQPGWPLRAARLLGITKPRFAGRGDGGTYGDMPPQPAAGEQAHRDFGER